MDNITRGNNPKLTIKDQIEYLESKGIEFQHFTKEQAEQFLEENNYLSKIKLFTANYEMDKNGKYINLDFAYLRELSIIDTLWRYLILELFLTCEHFLKTQIISHVSFNEYENGYDIVEAFLKEKNSNLNNYIGDPKDTYRKEILEKYSNRICPIWHFVELLHFSSFMDFYNFYFKKYNDGNKKPFLSESRRLRNDSAHNCCIIHKFHSKEEFHVSKYFDKQNS